MRSAGAACHIEYQIWVRVNHDGRQGCSLLEGENTVQRHGLATSHRIGAYAAMKINSGDYGILVTV